MRPESSNADGQKPQTSGLGHWLGFAVSGGTSFVVDSAVLKLLTAVIGAPVLPSRVVSIFTAMVVGWWMHRTFTFRVSSRPTLAEFGRFVGAAAASSIVNYIFFAALLYWRPGIEPVVAVFIASLVAMVVSYFGFRFGVFRK